ncbi:MAG: DUF3373 family protein [Candidatus Krumholzibacteriia bacterium]
MRKLSLLVVTVLVLSLVAGLAQAAEKDLDKRVRKLEQKSLKERLAFTGEYRFEAHNLNYEFPAHFDGMQLQALTAGTMFYFQRNFDGMDPMTGFPPTVDAIHNEIAGNYGDWRYFADNLTFDQLKAFLGNFDAASQQMLMGLLMPATAREAYDVTNDILYTSRLRLNMEADVADNVSFHGRLSMYKTWGDATGYQMFNGQSNSFIIDGNTANVPNSDIVRVERAYFTWTGLFDSPLYLSIGRRPSTDGPPLNLRNDEPRGGSPMGSLIDMQFDGITVGYPIPDLGTVRLCYGLGYESQYGNGLLTENPLKDAHFLGLNWDVWDKDDMLIQTTVARGFNITDGFNGNVALPNNPVTGEPIGAPVNMRFSPSTNVGDVDLMGLLVMRRDGAFDWFASYNYMQSHADDVTTPFGGLFCDPFETPADQDGSMIYLGARYNFNKDRTKLGVEYNHGSQYWFNFTPAQDDIVNPKTNTRGSVIEAYLTHRIARRFIAKLGYQLYDYDYSGSGWQLGTPKKLSDTPVLGYATYDKAQALSLSLMARF